MRTLSEILKDGEKVAEFTVSGDYIGYEFIIDESADLDRMDISGALEYTLHRMKEEGFTDEEIRYNCNMFIPSNEEMEEMEEFDEYISIDLGYIIGGLIMGVFEIYNVNN